MSREAMKLALEALEYIRNIDTEVSSQIKYGKAAQSIEEALAEQPAQQEPVAKHYANGGHLIYPKAQRPWVGLTHEEAEEVWKRVEASDFRDVVQPFARAIEVALRSKNEPR